jgi:hypothetical protein
MLFRSSFPFSTGGLITGIIGILIQPWRLLADPSGYIFGWLVGYSGGLGSDRRRTDRGLLDSAEEEPQSRRSLSEHVASIKAGIGVPVIATLLGCFFRVDRIDRDQVSEVCMTLDGSSVSEWHLCRISG